MLSNAIRKIPPCISLARVVVGSARSIRRVGFVDLEFVWIQNRTFPRRYPKMVPVMVFDEDEELELKLGCR